MRKCDECGKKIGVIGSYDHPIKGEDKTVCKSCYDNLIKGENSYDTYNKDAGMNLRNDLLIAGIFLVIFGIGFYFLGSDMVYRGGFLDLQTASLLIYISYALIFIGISSIVIGIVLPKKQEKGAVSKENKVDANEVLKLRYAKGEIKKEEYEEMKKDIEGWNWRRQRKNGFDKIYSGTQ